MDTQKIKAFRGLFDKFVSENQQAIKGLGLTVQQKNASYKSNEATLKIQLIDLGDNGKVVDVIGNCFRNNALLYGLQADDLGRTFTQNGKRFKIVGLKPSYRKYPVIAECNGKQYKFPAETVKTKLKGGDLF